MAVSCTKVDQLNNEATILAVSVSSVMPEDVRVKDPIIVENTIEIPLEFGKYLFPITIDLNVQTSVSCVEVLNFDEGTSLTFNDLAHQRTIYTVAESGATYGWIVKFKNISDNENAEILEVDIVDVVNGNNLIVGKRGMMVDILKSKIWLPVVGDITYPLVFDLKFKISDDATIESTLEHDQEGVYSLRFKSATEKATILIESENGRQKEWTVQPREIAVDEYDLSSSVTEDQAERLALDYERIALFPSTSIDTDNINGNYCQGDNGAAINIYAEDMNLTYPVSFGLYIPLKKDQVILNPPTDNIFNFESFTSPNVLYVQDLLSGVIKRWSISLYPFVGNTVNNFSVEQVSCDIANINPEAVGLLVDNQNQSIIVAVEKNDGTPIDGVIPSVVNLSLTFSYLLFDGTLVPDVEVKMVYLDDVATISVPILGGAAEQKWTISVEDKNDVVGTTADIIAADFSSISAGVEVIETILDPISGTIVLMVEGNALPIYMNPVFTTSNKATVSGIVNNTLVFSSFSDVNTFMVTSEDQRTTKEWSVILKQSGKVQIPNSDFELWGTFNDVNNGTVTIDPTPGVGQGWATANLKMVGIGVIGTAAVEYNGGFASQMKTVEQNTVLKGYVMAAGTTYTGRFDPTDAMGHIDTPWEMTYFGIPFTARPVSFSLDLRYKAGQQLKQARKEGRKYVIHNIEGVDKGHIWVKLLHWGGSGPLKYHSKPVDGLTVIGETSLIMDGGETKYNNWSNISLDMDYHSEHYGLIPTHIAIVMSSSSRGDEFIGATGSELTVDNFVINY